MFGADEQVRHGGKRLRKREIPQAGLFRWVQMISLRQLLRTEFGQGTGRYPQEPLVSGRLARERQLLHPLRVRNRDSRSHTFWQRGTNVWREVTSPALGKQLIPQAAYAVTRFGA